MPRARGSALLVNATIFPRTHWQTRVRARARLTAMRFLKCAKRENKSKAEQKNGATRFAFEQVEMTSARARALSFVPLLVRTLFAL